MENVNSIKWDVYIPLQEKWILAIRLQVFGWQMALFGFFDEEAFVVMVEDGGGFFVSGCGLGDEVVFVGFVHVVHRNISFRLLLV